MRNALVTSIVLATGCVQPYIEMDVGGDSSTSTSSTTSAEEEEEIEEPERPPQLEEGDGEGDDGDPTVGFIQDPDGGGESYQCDPWVQDCPDGEKCSYWANDGGGSWNATKCVPIDPDPAAVGEPCTVTGSGVSGIDTCELGAMCWNVDPDTNAGECIALCSGSEANPTCPPETHCVGRDFLICIPTCCPLLQDCAEGQACYPGGHTFDCVPDVSGEQGAFGDPCEYINVCDAGLFCADAVSVPSCESSIGCCTRFCDIAADQCALLHPDLECIAWYEEGDAPPGEEHIGGCMIPQ